MLNISHNKVIYFFKKRFLYYVILFKFKGKEEGNCYLKQRKADSPLPYAIICTISS